jgi:hypothetical protein
MATLNVSDLNRQGKVFVGANSQAANHIAVTTAMTGLILWNPPSSNRKLVLIDWGFLYTTAPGGINQVGLAIGTATTTLPTSVTLADNVATAADGSGNVGQGVVYKAATLAAAPKAYRWMHNTMATSSSGVSVNVDRVDGSIILAPGATVCTTVVQATAAGMAHFTWAELPL